MKTHRVSVLVLVVSLPFLVLSVPATASVHKNVILAVLRELRNSVDIAVERLNAKTTAHQDLARELGRDMPRDLAQGLLRELNILKVLQQVNLGVFPIIIDAETSVAEGKQRYSVQQIEGMIAVVQETHKELGEMMATQSEERQACKRRLNGVLDALMVANPGRAAAYVRIKTGLDPDRLDLDFRASQKANLAVLVLVLNALR